MKGIVYYKDKLRKYHSWIILRAYNCCCCCCFCIWKRHIKLVHPKLGGIIVWEFNFSKTSKPKSISLSFRCGLRFVKGCRPGSTCSEVARYENNTSSLLPKCFWSTLGVQLPTPLCERTLGMRLSCSRSLQKHQHSLLILSVLQCWSRVRLVL